MPSHSSKLFFSVPGAARSQTGAVHCKLVLWRHWTHLDYMHPVTSEIQFHCTSQTVEEGTDTYWTWRKKRKCQWPFRAEGSSYYTKGCSCRQSGGGPLEVSSSSPLCRWKVKTGRSLTTDRPWIVFIITLAHLRCHHCINRKSYRHYYCTSSR